MNGRTSRRGYAMLLVVVFLALVLSMYSLSYRHLAATLRVETARTLQQQRDEGSMLALARGLALLETGLPPADPYTCAVVLETSTGKRSFTVTFSSDAAETWLVQAAPTAEYDDPEPMPETFAPPDEPPGPGDKPPKKPVKEPKKPQPVKEPKRPQPVKSTGPKATGKGSSKVGSNSGNKKGK